MFLFYPLFVCVLCRCCPCKHEIVDGKAKVEDARRECQESFDEIAAKQQRKIKNRVAVVPVASSEQDGSAIADVEIRDAKGLESPGAISDEAVVKTGSSRGGIPNQTEGEEESEQRSRKLARGKDRKGSKRSSAAKSGDEQRERNRSASSSSSASSVLGFTNLGNTCYFNAAMQALLTAAHYFPEHVHIDDALEASNIPVLMTFWYNPEYCSH